MNPWNRKLHQPSELIPWRVSAKHHDSYEMVMLQLEERRRAGKKLAPGQATRLSNWKRLLKSQDLVVHYESGVGFMLVRSRPGDSLIRA